MIWPLGRSAASAASGQSAEPEPCCTVSAETATVPNAMSPARLLAKSLTSCETRDEWVKEPSDFSSGVGIREIYRNKARDLTVSRWWAMYAGSGVSTPFELTKAEQKIVEEALDAFDRRKREEREAAALHRLTAQAGEAGTAETAKTGSARRASTRSRSDAPKGGRS